jgi:type I restriction enzyme S subunit
MIDALKPYPKYKDSGVPWFGEVPEHWDVRSLGSLTVPRSERRRPELPLLSVVREKGVILRASMGEDENHNFIPDDLSNYKVVHRGDLVINKMKAWQGSLGVALQDGIVSPAYYVYRLDFEDLQFAPVSVERWGEAHWAQPTRRSIERKFFF